ncbi:hypothetical protein DUZ99_04390 [Xylanibacillus composti]|uniref:Uncharacterized protein n=1 Tax=Xylanibacillus composti TaxID=1572762 RepID=A0A8J4M282_9BACL|nr:hypothetical protein [Xylanibacillus composti]MDT9724227.1 hypothetical protein [Xylanibacillus composti]GIQ68256.1 hypothetical protein XYCOK13_10800 [Xylanibacillus composti]
MRNRDRRKGNGWKGLIRGQSGAVSVMVMIILSALLFAQAVLLELGKVWAAEREAEAALKAAVRSALSVYDQELQAYGLYGASKLPAEAAFREVLEANMSSLQPASFWSAAPIALGEAHIRMDRSLADPNLFEAQLLEEMKYRAPVEYVLLIMEPWLDEGVADQLSRGSTLRSSLKELEALISQREAKLDEAGEDLQQMLAPQGRSGTVYQQLMANFSELHQLAEQIGILDLEVIRKELQAAEEERSGLIANRNQLQQQLHLIALSMQAGPNPGAVEAMRQISEQIARLTEAIHNLSERVSDLSQQVKRLLRYWELIGEAESRLEEHYDWLVSRQDSAGTHLREAREINEQLRRKTEEAQEAAEQSIPVYPGSFFTDTEIGASEAVGQFGALRASFRTMELATGSDFVNIHGRLVRLAEAWRNTSHDQWSIWNTFDQKRKQQQAEAEKQKAAEEERTEQVLGQLQDLLYQCPGEDQEQYRQLRGHYQLYAGEQIDTVQESDQPANMEVDAAGSKAFSLADEITGALLGARDKAYVSEYVLNKFTYRTFEGLSHEKAHNRAHMLANQEAEYVIYGLDSCAANHSAAFAEMFLIRLAIRTVEALMDPGQRVLTFMSPWLTFLWALAEGAVAALADMRKLVQGERVELSAKLPKALAFSYKDYLRMFLLLHPHSRQRTARLQSLVHANTGRNLHDAYTYAEVTLRGEARMMIIPGQIAVRKEAAWSY